jgi:hypothetical protein
VGFIVRSNEQGENVANRSTMRLNVPYHAMFLGIHFWIVGLAFMLKTPGPDTLPGVEWQSGKINQKVRVKTKRRRRLGNFQLSLRAR